MRRSILILLIAAAACLQAEDKVLMTINGKPVHASEFMYIYEKNNQGTAIEKKSIDEYVDMFVNFKLKVAEAEAQGIDTTASFKKELKGYRAQAIPKYMKDEAAIDSLVELSYHRMAMDRRAAHIVVACPMGSSDSAEQAALIKINTLRERVTVGLPVKKGKGKRAKVTRTPEDFFAVAMEASEDPDLQRSHGELGWVIPFRYVYSLEDVVYRTPVGEVSEVIRTPFGYHFVLVEEELPHKDVNAAHIMKMAPRDDAAQDSKAKAEIDSIYTLLQAGADFAATAQKLSDDKGSATRGGELGWFRRGMMVRAFEEVAYALQGDSAMSTPFRSEYGWHILKKYGERGIEPLDSLRAGLRKNVERDERMKEADKSFIRKARAEYNLPDTLTDEQVREYADSQLENKYEDLRNLVREYHDGILLFEVSLKEVWDKAGQDTKGLEWYFQQHKKEYQWNGKRFKGYLVEAKNENAAKVAKAIINNCIKTHQEDSVSIYIDRQLNGDSIKYVKLRRGLWEKGQNKAIDQYAFKVKGTEYKASEDFPIVYTIGKQISKPQSYIDERAKVTTGYQDYLEQEWVKRLREKYEVVIDRQVLEELK